MTTNTEDKQHHSILQAIAHRAMLERGLVPDFPKQALAELARINAPATGTGPFTITGGFAPNGSGGTVVGVKDGLGDFLFLNFVTPTPGSVAGYTGGPLGSTTNIFNSNTGGFNFIQTGSMTPTPEPSSLLLLGAAASGLGLLRKRITIL